MKRFPLTTLLVGALATAIHFIPAVASHLEFSRAALERGAVWRLATGHLTHFNAEHLRWDVVAFLLLGAVAERFSRRDSATALFVAALVISGGVWALQPQFSTYRGLSGLDSALFGFVAGRLFSEGWRMRHRYSIVVACIGLAGFGVKCAFELVTQTTVFVTSHDFTPVPLAHALGGTTGVIVAILSVRKSAVEEPLQLRNPDRLHRPVEPQLLNQRRVAERI